MYVTHWTVHVWSYQYKHNMLYTCTHKAMRQQGVMYLVCSVVIILHQVYKKGENLSGTLTMAVPHTGCTLWQGLQKKKRKVQQSSTWVDAKIKCTMVQHCRLLQQYKLHWPPLPAVKSMSLGQRSHSVVPGWGEDRPAHRTAVWRLVWAGQETLHHHHH